MRVCCMPRAFCTLGNMVFHVPPAKRWGRRCGICHYFCIEDLLLSDATSFAIIIISLKTRDLGFYEVIKLISHDKSRLCLVCSGLHIVC